MIVSMARSATPATLVVYVATGPTALNAPHDAVEVGRLLVEEFPDSYSAHGYLAELYPKHGDCAPALAEFSTAYALGRSQSSPAKTVQEDDLNHYRRLIAELRARLTSQVIRD